MDKEIEDSLNRIIDNLINGPAGDPIWEHCASAAEAFILLKKLGLKVKNENDIRLFLEHDNICNVNFLEDYDG